MHSVDIQYTCRVSAIVGYKKRSNTSKLTNEVGRSLLLTAITPKNLNVLHIFTEENRQFGRKLKHMDRLTASVYG